MRKLLTIALILFLCLNLYAQKYTHKLIAEDIKYIMLLDSKERLWYSNENNIVMYDGEFHNQEIVPVKEKNNLIEDNNGNLWGAVENGFICFNNKKWINYPYQNKLFNGTKTVLMFTDNSGRIYFFNETEASYGKTAKIYLAIFENDKFSFITDNLPNKIDNICEYKEGAVFGNKYGVSDNSRSCGYYDEEYQLLTEGEIYDFYYNMEGLLTSDATNLKTPEIFQKYKDINRATLAVDTLIILTNNLVACYFKNENKIKEYSIPDNYQEFTENVAYMFYQNNVVYLATLNKGILIVKENEATLFNKKSGLPDNEITEVFIDKNYNWVIMHPKASSVLVDGNWKHFNKDSGYELNSLFVKSLIDLNGKKYISAYNTSGMGKNNKLLQWDGQSWESFDFQSKYSFTHRIKPFVFNNDIWYFNHNGNNYKGLLYFDGEVFSDYPLGKKVKDNLISTVSCSDESFYVHSSGLSGSGQLFKITLK